MSVQQPLPANPQNIDDLTTRLTGFLQDHGKKIAIAAGALGAIILIVNYVRSSAEEERAQQWGKFAEAKGAEELGVFATDNPNSVAGTWARLLEAEQSFRMGVSLQFSNRSGAESELKRAGAAFDKVLGATNAPTIATERALIGKARLLETTSDGNFDEAIKAYKAFKEKYPDSIYKDVVQERLDALAKARTKEFYAWFAKQNPKPSDRKKPNDGLPPGHPEIPIMLPEIPEGLYPANWSELKTDAEIDADKTTSEKTSDAKPATDAKPVTEEKK